MYHNLYTSPLSLSLSLSLSPSLSLSLFLSLSIYLSIYLTLPLLPSHSVIIYTNPLISHLAGHVVLVVDVMVGVSDDSSGWNSLID